MIGTPLALVEKSCVTTLAEALPSVLNRSVKHEQMVMFCTCFRRLGIAQMFMGGLPEPFFRRLSASARAFAFYLEGASEEGKITSKSAPFFDAVACNDSDAMVAIAKHARTTWNEGEENEDHFLYMRFLIEWFALAGPKETLEALLARFEAVLEGESEPRLELCRAYLTCDQPRFEKALQELIEARQVDLENSLADERMPPDDVPTTARLWVELLALLRMADITGLATEAHYPMAPGVARQIDRAGPVKPDAWKEI